MSDKVIRSHPTVILHRLTVVSLGATVPILHGGLDDRSSGPTIAFTVALWGLWGILLLGMLVPSSVALTAARLAVASHTATIVVLTIRDASDSDGIDTAGLVAVAISVGALLIAFTAEVGNSYVQGSAYGDERRFLLKAPHALAAAQVVSFGVWFATTFASVSALVAGAWIVGLLLALPAVLLSVILPSRFHRFSRRWLVKVPAGLVVHDHVVLAETAMFTRSAVRSIAVRDPGQRTDPDDLDSPSDLTGGLRGGVVVSLDDFDTVVLAARTRRDQARPVHLRSFAVRPSRVVNAVTELTRP